MNNLPYIFIPKKENSMTAEEKKTIWMAISARTFEIEKNKQITPVRKGVPSRLYYRGLLPTIGLRGLCSLTRGYMLGIIAGTLIVSGSVSAFAQGALPGDLLYGVKTNVNEKLQVTLAFTPQAKASIEATLASKRLEEAEKLALEGKLNPTLEQSTNKAFNTHVRKFETQLSLLERRAEYKAIAKVGIFFQTRIAVHVAVLKDIEVNNKILSSGTVIRTPNSNVDSNVATLLEKKVLSAIIPTVLATNKALVIISTTTQEDTAGYKKNNILLNIDTNEAKEYLTKLHEDIGVPAPLLENTPAPIVPVFIP